MMRKRLPDIPTYIETERLCLRPYQAGDGAWYYAMSLRNRSHLARYEPQNPVMSIQNEQEAEALVREFRADWMTSNFFLMGAFDKATDQFIAQIYVGPLNWDLPEIAIGYFVDCDHEGQGYVTEAVQAAVRFAFDHLGARRVSIECDDTNVRSYGVAERCGFVREGHIRENKRHADGTLTGTLHYGLLRNEFDRLRTQDGHLYEKHRPPQSC